jgi:hypothetical protein
MRSVLFSGRTPGTDNSSWLVVSRIKKTKNTATSAGCMRPTSLCHEGDGVSKDMKKAAGFFLEGHGVAKLGINNLLLTSRILKAGA